MGGAAQPPYPIRIKHIKSNTIGHPFFQFIHLDSLHAPSEMMASIHKLLSTLEFLLNLWNTNTTMTIESIEREFGYIIFLDSIKD